MSGNLGLEDPERRCRTAQNLILYPYINPATEVLDGIELPPGVEVTPMPSPANDGTQIWKITHNGVDTHPIHFHLFDVQLINRVGWDGIIRPPDANELGWKDTVRISPLEDTIVAMRPIIPKLPVRGSRQHTAARTRRCRSAPRSRLQHLWIANGNTPITRSRTNGQLRLGVRLALPHPQPRRDGHDAADDAVAVDRTLPTIPVVTVTGDAGQRAVTLTWTDGTPVDYGNLATWGSPANEVGFRVERATVADNGTVGPYSVIRNLGPNVTEFTDAAAVLGTTYSYRVVAWNAAGDSISAPAGAGEGYLRVTTSPALPSQILVNGVPRDTWGLTWLKLPPGDYEVSFTDMPGFTTPAPQTVTVLAGVTPR